jgi:hypothetical protein
MNNTLLGQLAPLQASIGDHIPAIQREERVSEREKGEIIAVPAEGSLDPNNTTPTKSGPFPLYGDSMKDCQA